jgi:hypothetical protein
MVRIHQKNLQFTKKPSQFIEIHLGGPAFYKETLAIEIHLGSSTV